MQNVTSITKQTVMTNVTQAKFPASPAQSYVRVAILCLYFREYNLLIQYHISVSYLPARCNSAAQKCFGLDVP